MKIYKSVSTLVLILFGSMSGLTGCASKPRFTNNRCDILDTSPAQQWLVRVPFETIDGRIFVQAKVNDKGPFRFAVDTGASGEARADSRLVNTLGLPVAGVVRNSDGVQTANAETTQIDSLQLDRMTRQNLEVITRDYSGRSTVENAFYGIIARDFFEHGLLVIDYPSKTLYFSPSLSIPVTDQHALRYERAFRIPVSIGDLKLEGNMDTGANVNFVLPKSLYDKLPATALQAAGVGTLSNSTVNTQRTTVQGPFRIGDLTLTNVDVRVSDRYPELLIGAHALQSSRILIDQRSKLIRVCH